MLFRPPGKPTTSKKIAYLTLATFLGLLLSFIAHAAIELIYLRWAENQNISVPFYGGCSLTPQTQITITVIGIIGGFFVGNFWWKKIYIERTWRKRKRRQATS